MRAMIVDNYGASGLIDPTYLLALLLLRLHISSRYSQYHPQHHETIVTIIGVYGRIGVLCLH